MAIYKVMFIAAVTEIRGTCDHNKYHELKFDGDISSQQKRVQQTYYVFDCYNENDCCLVCVRVTH